MLVFSCQFLSHTLFNTWLAKLWRFSATVQERRSASRGERSEQCVPLTVTSPADSGLLAPPEIHGGAIDGAGQNTMNKTAL